MKPDSVHSPGVQDKLCAPDPISGRSLNFWEFPKWIIELVADNGLIGLGEPRRGDLLSRHFGRPIAPHRWLALRREIPTSGHG